MSDLFVPDVPVWEKMLRSAVVYLFMLVAIRFTGKRQVGQLTPFDLVVLLIISNVVQNAIIGDDNSLGGGLIGAVTIFVLNAGVAELSFRSKRARDLLEPTPTLLIHNGRLLHRNLKMERVTVEEILAALRQHGMVEPGQVHLAVLEENGAISVIPFTGQGRSGDAPPRT